MQSRLRRPMLVAMAGCLGCATAAGCDLGLAPFQEDAGDGDHPPTQFDSGGGIDAKPPGMDASDDTFVPDARNDVVTDADAALAKRVFVTSAAVPGSFGGVAQADAICMAAAGAGNGTFRAWISIANAPAIAHVMDVGPWYLVDRKTLVFPNLATIAQGNGPAVPIDRDEKGLTVGPGQNVWTGTTKNGQPSGNNCQSFTIGQAPFVGTTGRLVANANWTEGDNTLCAQSAHIYCFEQ